MTSKSLQLALLLALFLCACGGPPYTAPLTPHHDHEVFDSGSSSARKDAAAPLPSEPLTGHGDDAPPALKRRSSGLGTRFGETRYSAVSEAPFERAMSNRPFAGTKIYYNDFSGIRHMTSGHRWLRRRSFALANGHLELSVEDAHGRPLPAALLDGRRYVRGRSGDRYRIVVSNHSSRRIEAVVSVDGLDVIDGESASFDKRGYLLQPHGSVVIDGFRRSMRSVAAFRFGSVEESYTVRKNGSSRHVGVIGLALFNEYGAPPLDWPTWRDGPHRRQDADPFPGRFATPPGR